MDRFSYIDKNEFFGVGAINNIEKIVEKDNFENLLVVTGRKSYETSGLKKFLSPLLKNKEHTIINDFEVNPKYEDIKRIGKFLKTKKLDLIIAGGGGSVIDFAKGLNVYLSTSSKDGQDGILNSELLKGNFLPMIAVPTTAGTGSEATHFAVAYVNEKKISIADKGILPKYAIIDPRLCYNSPVYITACCAFDALCQAIESFWSRNATPKSKKYSKQAISLIKNNLAQTINNNCLKSRDNLSFGSFLAGKAINISKTTAPHALSYSLTSFFNIPHGHAVALTLGIFFSINESTKFHQNISNQVGLKNHLKNLNEIKQMMGWAKNSNFEAEWAKFMIECGLETKILKNQFSDIKLEDLIDSVNEDRLSNHPIKISKKEISNIYKQLFK